MLQLTRLRSKCRLRSTNPEPREIGISLLERRCPVTKNSPLFDWEIEKPFRIKGKRSFLTVTQDAIGGASFSRRVDLVGENVFGERFADRQIETCEQLG
jgi:hypothetical protein